MIDRELAEMLVCPKDRLPLKLADQPLLSRVNRAIAAGRLEEPGRPPGRGPLCTPRWFGSDDTLLYPIVDDIPVLLIEEAIALDQIEQETS